MHKGLEFVKNGISILKACSVFCEYHAKFMQYKHSLMHEIRQESHKICRKIAKVCRKCIKHVLRKMAETVRQASAFPDEYTAIRTLDALKRAKKRQKWPYAFFAAQFIKNSLYNPLNNIGHILPATNHGRSVTASI